jgi:hypothetical protein
MHRSQQSDQVPETPGSPRPSDGTAAAEPRALRIALAGMRPADLSGDPPDETVIDRLHNDQTT